MMLGEGRKREHCLRRYLRLATRCCGTPEYAAYVGAKIRCQNPKNPQWPNYGGRGIEFRFPSFAVFRGHLGRRPRRRVLGRINGDGHEATLKVRARKAAYAAARYVPTPLTITVRVNSCHPERRHYAFGLCVACYRVSPEGRAVQRRYFAERKKGPHKQCVRQHTYLRSSRGYCILPV